MRDIRDSISDALDRTITELDSKSPEIQEAFAAKTVPHAPAPAKAFGVPPPDATRDLIARAKAKLAQIEDKDIHGDFVHTEDPDVALLLSALESASKQNAAPKSFATATGEIIGVHKFDATDPRWILSAVNMVVSEKVPFPYPTGPDDAEVQLPERDITMGVAGDWGTGLYSSNQIGAFIGSRKPDLALHIGDVYYSGTEEEVTDKFVHRFPRGTFGTFALNSNHEMYSGGKGYFNITLKDPDFAAKQSKSFFSLYNSKWQLIALDTAYESEKAQLYQNGVIGSEQLGWFTMQLQKAKAAGRRIAIFTHHNPISVVEKNKQDTNLIQQILSAASMANSMFDYWFFGHEHAVAVFEPMLWNHKNVAARCIGHGGIPYPPATLGDKGQGVIARWTETTCYAVGKGDPKCALNGFAMYTFPISGADIVEQYFDDSNNLRYTVTSPFATIPIAAKSAPAGTNVAAVIDPNAPAAVTPPPTRPESA
jgi:hypothetical protein